MPREADLSLNEQNFILQGLREGVRIDDRDYQDYRNLKLEFGDEYGVVDVSLGKTRVVARVSSEVTTPFSDRKFEGIFNISTELSPMASPAFEANRPTITETLLSRLLEKTVRRSGALDTESLCLIAGVKCFAIRADLHVLVYDGNILDTACIALVTALQHFRRPDVTVEGEDVTVWDVREREPIKLSMLHFPYCVSLSYFENGDIVLVDATSSEEKLREGELVLSMNKFGELCQMAKYGGVSVDASMMLEWTRLALAKVRFIDHLVQERLVEDEKKRNVGDLMAELSAENQR